MHSTALTCCMQAKRSRVNRARPAQQVNQETQALPVGLVWLVPLAPLATRVSMAQVVHQDFRAQQETRALMALQAPRASTGQLAPIVSLA